MDDYDLEVYLVGNSSKCVIWNYDWFGFDSGRTRQMCDFIAAHGNQSSDDLDLQIKIVIGRSLFDLIADHFLPFF